MKLTDLSGTVIIKSDDEMVTDISVLDVEKARGKKYVIIYVGGKVNRAFTLQEYEPNHEN